MKFDKDELLTPWLADQIYDVIKNEDVAAKAMDLAQEELKIKNETNQKEITA